MANLADGEQQLFSGSADTLYFKTFRKGSVNLTLTDKRLIVTGIFKKEYPLDDVVSAKRFKSMFMNIGISFQLKDGKTINLATRHIKKVVEALQKLGKMESL